MALYRSAFQLVEGCSKTFQACSSNFQFFRTNFASSKVLSVIVCVSCLGFLPMVSLQHHTDRDVPARDFGTQVKLGHARSRCAQQGSRSVRDWH